MASQADAAAGRATAAHAGRAGEAAVRGATHAEVSSLAADARDTQPRAAHARAGDASTSAPLHAGGGAVIADEDELTFTQHMVAGAVAGLVEHLAMFPLDTVKTRMQAVPHGGASIAHAMNYGTMRAAVSTVLGQEGVRGLYRGVNAMALGAGPAHAFYFATYEVRPRGAGAACAEPKSRQGLCSGARQLRRAGRRIAAAGRRRALLRGF
jgi:solute carrier family 25 iron transporter 28/37